MIEVHLGQFWFDDSLHVIIVDVYADANDDVRCSILVMAPEYNQHWTCYGQFLASDLPKMFTLLT